MILISSAYVVASTMSNRVGIFSHKGLCLCLDCKRKFPPHITRWVGNSLDASCPHCSAELVVPSAIAQLLDPLSIDRVKKSVEYGQRFTPGPEQDLLRKRAFDLHLELKICARWTGGV